MTGRVINDPWHPDWDGPKELLPLLLAGKLEQTCTNCGKEEPAGGRCSQCGVNPGWRSWHRKARSEAQQRNDARLANLLKQNRSQDISRVHAAWCWLPSGHKGACEGDQ